MSKDEEPYFGTVRERLIQSQIPNYVALVCPLTARTGSSGNFFEQNPKKIKSAREIQTTSTHSQNPKDTNQETIAAPVPHH